MDSGAGSGNGHGNAKNEHGNGAGDRTASGRAAADLSPFESSDADRDGGGLVSQEMVLKSRLQARRA